MAKYTQSPSSLPNAVKCEYDIDSSLFQNDVIKYSMHMHYDNEGLNTWTLKVY